MEAGYSPEVCRQLVASAAGAGLLRPLHLTRHEAGDVLELDLTGVAPAWKARAWFEVERYVGGGFAGQVYRAVLRRADGGAEAASALPLVVGGTYALKMFVPWTRLGRALRDALYGVGFQAPFGLQTTPAAVRACALWHKLIRQGAAVRLGSADAVVDVHATFFDAGLGSMGEVLEWVSGRPWRLEVNDRLFIRPRHAGVVPPAECKTEYEAKRDFMRRMVALFHEMGAPELARQYEWWTMKSQPNVLKRTGGGGESSDGLVAVDFGPGLALLPFLPMSPGDVRLIARGLAAGRVVQFDRGDLDRLEEFAAAHLRHIVGLGAAVAELRLAETAYHDSQLDAAHHRLRVLTDGALRQRSCRAWAGHYEARRIMGSAAAERFSRRPLRLVLFILLGLVPLIGRLLQRLWGSAAYRRHAAAMLTDGAYLGRALRGHAAERLADWHRKGRAGPERALRLADRPVLFLVESATLGLLPRGMHRFLTDGRYAWRVLWRLIVRPVKLYFNEAFRREWLCGMIAEGRAEGLLSPAEADLLESQVDDPFIQKYLKCLAVHVCTLPVTQIVSGALAIYAFFFWAETWQEAWTYALGILALFQVTPISPGSFTRGAYVVYMILRDRTWKEYRVAAAVSFWKYIGYLGFPIQMVWKYPVLARFMAGRWATGAIHVVPVFGERGALLEHGAFNLFFNVPVSLRRRWQADGPERARVRGAARWVGAAGGIGFLPGPSGTLVAGLAAAAQGAAFYLGAAAWTVIAAAAATAVIGVPLAARLERRLGCEDPRMFVLDEVTGMLIAGMAAWMPWSRWGWLTLATAFLWFRVTDIWKPPPVRQLEDLPGGWGVVADDVMAGLYALALAAGCDLLLARFMGL